MTDCDAMMCVFEGVGDGLVDVFADCGKLHRRA